MCEERGDLIQLYKFLHGIKAALDCWLIKHNSCQSVNDNTLTGLASTAQSTTTTTKPRVLLSY